MAMDEFRAVLKARQFVRKVNPAAIPVPVELYAREVGAVIRPQTDLGPDEAGYCFQNNGKRFICTNANDRVERQRFTVCHEIAHVELGHPSQHGASPWWSYAKRPLAEILCDIFAAELLLPYDLFQPEAENASIDLAGIDDLAERFQASVTATGSRYAAVVTEPLAFVLSEEGKVRYASRSAPLKDAYAWIAPRLNLPDGCFSKKVRSGASCDGPEEVDADIWFSDWERGGTLMEEARHLSPWDQTITLLWFKDGKIPPQKRRDEQGEIRQEEEDENEGLLKELDGNLRWPGKRRRK
ncbi:MAG TPA: ImmA/IrrE family metallo-endopeptidase [Candidatus Acidoferrales bacterium]